MLRFKQFIKESTFTDFNRNQMEKNKAVPAAQRNNNPGAMWNGPSATAYGSDHYHVLGDAQKNHIASFPSKEQGAAAQFDLMNKYAAKEPTFQSAIKTWSGGNSPGPYAKALTDKLGMKPTDKITQDLVKSPAGIDLAKAQSHWETGRDFPMSDDQWKNAHDNVWRPAAPTDAPVPSRNPFRSQQPTDVAMPSRSPFKTPSADQLASN